MLTRILVWILARTNLARNISVSIVGALIASGVIDAKDGDAVLTGLLIIVLGGLNYLIEHTKSKHVAEVQEAIRGDGDLIKVDGYLGPKTKRALYQRMRGAP